MFNSLSFSPQTGEYFFLPSFSAVFGEVLLIAFCFSFRRSAGLVFNYGGGGLPPWPDTSSLKTIQLSPVLPPQSNQALFAPQWQVIFPLAVSLLEQKVVPGARRKRETAQSDGLPISSSGTQTDGEDKNQNDASYLTGSWPKIIKCSLPMTVKLHSWAAENQIQRSTCLLSKSPSLTRRQHN